MVCNKIDNISHMYDVIDFFYLQVKIFEFILDCTYNFIWLCSLFHATKHSIGKGSIITLIAPSWHPYVVD